MTEDRGAGGARVTSGTRRTSGTSGTAYVVRMATATDLPDLTRLRMDWAAAVRGPADEPGFAARYRGWWERQASSRVTWVAVAPDHGGGVVAMVNLAVFERMPLPGVPVARWGYLANLWVDRGHRRRGVGSALTSELLRWCRNERLDRVVLNPSEASKTLYASFGFRPAADLLRLDLLPYAGTTPTGESA